MLLFHPYQLPAHGRLRGRAPTSARLPSRDEAFRFAIDGSFRSGVTAGLQRKTVIPSGRGTRCIRK
jgi:hypothetical protein